MMVDPLDLAAMSLLNSLRAILELGSFTQIEVSHHSGKQNCNRENFFQFFSRTKLKSFGICLHGSQYHAHCGQ
jgi:hypothetical protein